MELWTSGYGSKHVKTEDSHVGRVGHGTLTTGPQILTQIRGVPGRGIGWEPMMIVQTPMLNQEIPTPFGQVYPAKGIHLLFGTKCWMFLSGKCHCVPENNCIKLYHWYHPKFVPVLTHGCASLRLEDPLVKWPCNSEPDNIYIYITHIYILHIHLYIYIYKHKLHHIYVIFWTWGCPACQRLNLFRQVLLQRLQLPRQIKCVGHQNTTCLEAACPVWTCYGFSTKSCVL